MIDSIHLKGFQSHQDTLIEFCPGVNLILGQSDHGKSSILRIVEWVRTNRPKGSSFLQRGYTGETSGEISINGLKVKRYRTEKSTGGYIVGKERFEVTGGDVPSEVTTVLGLDDINIQAQLDSHFLILDTPGIAAKYLNALTKLDILVTASEKLKSKGSTASSDLKNIRVELDNADRFLTSGIVEIISELKTKEKYIEKLIQDASCINRQTSSIKSILDRLKPLRDSKLSTQAIGMLTKKLNYIENLIFDFDKVNDNIKKLKNVLTGIHNFSELSLECEQEMMKIEVEINKVKKSLDTCPMCGTKLTA